MHRDGWAAGKLCGILIMLTSPTRGYGSEATSRASEESDCEVKTTHFAISGLATKWHHKTDVTSKLSLRINHPHQVLDLNILPSPLSTSSRRFQSRPTCRIDLYTSLHPRQHISPLK
jgi:hypothetical protein